MFGIRILINHRFLSEGAVPVVAREQVWPKATLRTGPILSGPVALGQERKENR
jgi:hypothetical protein